MRKVQLNTIKGFEEIHDYYFINEKGQIFGYGGEEIFGRLTADGYRRVGFRIKGTRKSRHLFAHRLVALAFIPNPENKPQVNHIDENKLNNHIDNLEWATAKEQANHGTRIERQVKSQSHPIEGYDPETGEIKVRFSSLMEAGRNGFTPGSISQVINGRRNMTKHKGLAWRRI